MEHLAKVLSESPHPVSSTSANTTDISFSYQTSSSTKTTISSQKLINQIYIPVVVHIVLDDPTIIKDEEVYQQIESLNTDFAGLNANTANLPTAFKDVLGTSNIQFVLAKRDPLGNFTNGIERKVSTINYNAGPGDQIKFAVQGGLNAWNPNQYLNIWVGKEGGILGYATFPGIGNFIEQGLVIDITGFGSNSCYTDPSYSQGKTLAHEMGHFFGLYHIWGDDTDCSGDDFAQLPGACSLPTSLFNPTEQGNTINDIGDTPNMTDETTGCPSGNQTDACNLNTAGRMYQNFMDYTNDACYSLFTKKQVERMEWVAENCRANLLTSPAGNLPISTPPYNASIINIISPGGAEYINCNKISYSASLTCPSNIQPKITIRNDGSAILTSVNIGISINDGAPVTSTYNINLPTGLSTILSLSSVATLAGTNKLEIFIISTNGVSDQNSSQDTITYMLQVAPLTGSYTQDFEGVNFPPEGWAIINPDGNITWQKLNGNLGLPNSSGTAAINLFAYNTINQQDILQSPTINTTGADSVFLSFDYAYSANTNGQTDTLEVVATASCGQANQTIIKLSGTNLTTTAPSGTSFIPQSSNNWKTITLALTNFISQNEIALGFKAINKKGNNLFIDNINIRNLPPRDIAVKTFTNLHKDVCGGSILPVVRIINEGAKNLTSFIANFSVDGGAVNSINVTGLNLRRDSSYLYTLSPLNLTVGNHSIQFFTTAPNAGNDNNTINDTIALNFTVLPILVAPFSEGFENVNFPPDGWTVQQLPIDPITWTRTTQAAKTGIASAYMNNYNYAFNGRIDDLISPPIQYEGDSVILKFDIAAAIYSDPNTTITPLDTLEVLASSDCGNTYQSVYKKWGTALQTLDNPSTDEFFPDVASQWRTDSVNLTSLFGSSNTVRIKFRCISNFENNIFIDNVSLYTKHIPKLLSEKGYLIYPNPFTSDFIIQHSLPPTKLRSITIYNALGQQVLVRNYIGNADQSIHLNIGNLAAGIYTITMDYNNKSVSEKIIKMNQ